MSPTVRWLCPLSPQLRLLCPRLRSWRTQAADDRELVVLISPHEASIVQRTVDVMDVCDRLQVGKSLQTDLGMPEGV